jgi:hypothetical protein
MNGLAMNLLARIRPVVSSPFRTPRLGVALLACCLIAAAPAKTRVDGNHVHVMIPATWKPAPEIAAGMKKSFAGKKGVAGDAVAWGDAKAGVTGLLLWIDVLEPMQGNTLQLQEAFIGGVIKSLPRAGENARREQKKTHVVLHGSSKADDSDLTTLATAVIGKDGRLHGYMLTCVRTGDAASRARAVAACDTLMASFELTWKDSELQPLEKK